MWYELHIMYLRNQFWSIQLSEETANTTKYVLLDHFHSLGVCRDGTSVARDLSMCAICKMRYAVSKSHKRSLQISDLNLTPTLTLTVTQLTLTQTLVLSCLDNRQNIQYTAEDQGR